MAKIELSGIISNIAGSVGSLVFKRTPNGFSVNIKNRTKSKYYLQQNKALILLRTVIQKWDILSQTVKDQYVIESKNYSFKDKFGKQVFLNPRMFFIKLNTRNYLITKTLIQINKITSVINDPIIDKIISNSNVAVTIILKSFLVDTSILVQFQYLKNDSISAYQTKRIFSFISNDDKKTDFNINNELIYKYPYIKKGDKIRLYIYFQNNYGFRTTPQTFDITIQ